MNRSLVLVLGWVLWTAVPASADLSGLQQAVETTEQAPAPTPTPAPGADRRLTDQDSHHDLISDILGSIFQALWVTDNTATAFGDYPYAPGGWIRVPQWTFDQGSGTWVAEDLPGRTGWQSVSTEAFHLDGLGSGVWVTWKGYLYRFIGPYMEGWSLTDGTSALSGGRAGLTFSLVQSDPLCLGVYVQAQGWAGILNRAGGTVGLEFRSYPVQPLDLEARLGFQLFDRFQVGEAEVRAGWLFGPWEALAGWRWWTLEDRSGNKTGAYGGPFTGVKLFF